MNGVIAEILTPNLKADLHGRENSSVSVDIGAKIISVSDYDQYDGPYVVTPSQEEQILDTTKKTMKENVVIMPIPSNYGKVTWDGATLRIE